MLQLALGKCGNLLQAHAHLLEYKLGNILAFGHDAQQEMDGLDTLMLRTPSHVNRFLHSLLRLDCKVVECHIYCSFLMYCQSMF